jgi:methyl-accepting chemotaxis protein
VALNNCSGAEYQNRKLVEQTNASVKDIASQMETSFKLQEDLATGLKGAHDAQSLCLATVQDSVESSSQVISTIPSRMDEIQEHLQR